MTEYEAAERSDNQDLKWICHDEVQADGLKPGENQV